MQYNFSQLANMVKAFGDRYEVEVGIFGDHNTRGADKGKASTNSEIGAIHEFGSFTRKIPARSFLRMPVMMKTKDIIRQASVGMEALIADGKITTVLKRLGVAAENAVQQAFATHGFGQWKKDAPSTVRRKGSSAPLIDTAQLRRSISSRVVKS